MARGYSLGAGAVMYAVLHPPNFYAQAAAHTRPELRKWPFALLDGEPPAEFVIAANKAARVLGVEAGMTRLQAESFAEVVALSRSHKDEASAHTILHNVVCLFSPRIEHVEISPGTYALDIDGMNRLYGDAGQLAVKLRQHAMAIGFLANVGVAENFHAAVCLALGRAGVSVAAPGCESEALRDLPVRVLPLEPEHKATLHS